FAAGGAAQSARAVGVPVNRVKIGLFMTVGFLAWFTGMHLLFSFNTVQSGEGVGNEFLYIIAAVIGGCVLPGGFGPAAGPALGALQGISLRVGAGEVTCVLVDNGAGKSSLIKIMSGVHHHDEGTYKVEGQEVRFGSPREALNRGIATVYQDLAVVPLLSVWRNFFLGSEAETGVGGP